MDSSQTAVGQRVKELRKLNKFSGQALGDLLGLTKSAVSLIESGTVKLQYEHALRISQQFGVSVEWILQGTGNGAASQSVSAGRDMSGVNQAGGSVHQAGNNTDCETRLAVAEARIEELKEQLKDKDKTIAFLQSMLQKQ